MNKHSKHIFILGKVLFWFIASFQAYSQPDSITVYIDFDGINKGEQFKFFWYLEEVELHEMNSSVNLYYFKVPIPKDIKQYHILPVNASRKGRFQLKYHGINLDCRFQLDKRHILIRKDRKLKKKYSLSHKWLKKPLPKY